MVFECFFQLLFFVHFFFFLLSGSYSSVECLSVISRSFRAGFPVVPFFCPVLGHSASVPRGRLMEFLVVFNVCVGCPVGVFIFFV